MKLFSNINDKKSKDNQNLEQLSLIEENKLPKEHLLYN